MEELHERLIRAAFRTFDADALLRICAARDMYLSGPIWEDGQDGRRRY